MSILKNTYKPKKENVDKLLRWYEQLKKQEKENKDGKRDI